MSRIMQRLHDRAQSHDPLRGWCADCLGCKLAATKLCEMFNWGPLRGTIIPYAPRPTHSFLSDRPQAVARSSQVNP